jgi:hypothetical protein
MSNNYIVSEPKEASWAEKISHARKEVSASEEENHGYRVSTCTSRTLMLLLDHAKALEQRFEDMLEDTRTARMQQRDNDEY